MTQHIIDNLCVNTIRILAVDIVERAKSGHPGLPLGAAPMAYALWQWHLKHNPSDPLWADRDRFVLSAGHGSALLYALLHLTGYDLSLDDLKAFRQLGSRTPGHPETHITPGVEATTGPLGQGSANAVGMAIAERSLAAMFNRPNHTIVDHYTYALVSDGDLMEGVSAEAASLAGHLGLEKLIYLYDANDVTLDGPTSDTLTEDVAKRYQAYGWHVLEVKNGDTDLKAISDAIAEAKTVIGKPHLIIVRTTLGFGSPNKAGNCKAHGSPLGVDETKLTKQALGFDPEKSFAVPADATTHLRSAIKRGEAAQKQWNERFAAYEKAYPELATLWKQAQAGLPSADFDKDLPSFSADSKIATRTAAGQTLNAIAKNVPFLIGGDADLGGSTNTVIKDGASFNGKTGTGRNIHYGVREHAMGSIANGIAYHRGLRCYTATFFTFSDYMRPAIRLAALSQLPVVFVFTHDSVWLGEDGPTHQPIEHLMSLRAIPGLVTLRPADATEAAQAWRFAMLHTQGPTVIVLSRQNLPVLDRNKFAAASGLDKGAYVLRDNSNGTPAAQIIATGSEIALALATQDLLASKGIMTRVISMPSWEVFAAQDENYRQSVILPQVKLRISLEAGVTLGWHKWLGDSGVAIGIDHFGASAPEKDLAAKFGFTPENIAQIVQQKLNQDKD
ncbi:MAG: transketolase [Deltaproteobacteria bacterium]|nr:transketolase [Deltaproteobacteria bacterium]